MLPLRGKKKKKKKQVTNWIFFDSTFYVLELGSYLIKIASMSPSGPGLQKSQASLAYEHQARSRCGVVKSEGILMSLVRHSAWISLNLTKRCNGRLRVWATLLEVVIPGVRCLFLQVSY